MSHELPYIAAIGEAIQLEMERDPTVLYFGQNIATTDDDPFLTAFGPDRVRVTPISETAEIGMAVGAALAGYRPVVELYMAEPARGRCRSGRRGLVGAAGRAGGGHQLTGRGGALHTAAQRPVAGGPLRAGRLERADGVLAVRVELAQVTGDAGGAASLGGLLLPGLLVRERRARRVLGRDVRGPGDLEQVRPGAADGGQVRRVRPGPGQTCRGTRSPRRRPGPARG